MIADETVILPEVIADAVVGELARHFHFKLGVDLPNTDVLAAKLADKAERHYAANPKFRAKVKKNNTFGRDWHYTFMRHWLAAELKDSRVPYSFANGEAL